MNVRMTHAEERATVWTLLAPTPASASRASACSWHRTESCVKVSELCFWLMKFFWDICESFSVCGLVIHFNADNCYKNYSVKIMEWRNHWVLGLKFFSLFLCVPHHLDINECNMPNKCPNGHCINSEGSFVCECRSGFTKNQRGECEGTMIRRKFVLLISCWNLGCH